MMTKDQFVRCYLTAVLFWEHCINDDDDDDDDAVEYLDTVYTIDDFSPEALERASADCSAFLQAAENAGFRCSTRLTRSKRHTIFISQAGAMGPDFGTSLKCTARKRLKYLTK